MLDTALIVDDNGYFLGVLGLYFSGWFVAENPVLEKSVTLVFRIGWGLTLFIVLTSSEGFGKVIFFLELGLRLMSGKNDSPVVFYNRSTRSGLSTFYWTGKSAEDFFFNLLKSNPPPVISYFFAFLSYSSLSLAYYCSLRCFLSASSALLCVSFLLSSSSVSFFILSSAILCLSSSAFLFLSSSLSSRACLFFSSSYFSLSDT